jgi:hypothetical protein
LHASTPVHQLARTTTAYAAVHHRCHRFCSCCRPILPCSNCHCCCPMAELPATKGTSMPPAEHPVAGTHPSATSALAGRLGVHPLVGGHQCSKAGLRCHACSEALTGLTCMHGNSAPGSRLRVREPIGNQFHTLEAAGGGSSGSGGSLDTSPCHPCGPATLGRGAACRPHVLLLAQTARCR